MAYNFGMRQAFKYLQQTGQVEMRKLSPRLCRSFSSEQNSPAFKHIKVDTPSAHVYHVILNRPEKRNAMNALLWREIGECFNWLGKEPNCRVVILSGAGKMFTSGIDVNNLIELGAKVGEVEDVARKFKTIHDFVGPYQDSFTELEKCSKPIIAAVHGGCIGGGVDLISATDIRYCTKDATFCIKEVDVGLAADVGTLQRLPRIVSNQSLVRELAYTARNMHADEALSCGLVSKVLPDQEALLGVSFELAKTIAAKSPVCVQGTKINLLYSRDHTVQQGLDFNRFWSSVMLQSEDAVIAASSQISRDSEPPKFAKL